MNDVERGYEAYFLAIESVSFTNGRNAIEMKARHPSLVARYVDRFAVSMYADRDARPVNRRTYLLVWQKKTDVQFRRGLHLYRSEPGMEYPRRVRCRGVELKRVSATSSREGRVSAKVPQRCVAGTRFVKFNYTVSNFGGDVHDTAPGGNNRFGTYSRWVKRS
ncbi:MAG: hypothetical protein CMH83_15265 [Nocardioides sp.]|nr:hypothetical protein [Nocardioides sp.]